MNNQSKGIFRLGTSGIVVPGTKLSFPAEFRQKSRLNYYSTLFNTLEVNSTFHKFPRFTTLEKWSLDVGGGFQFTLKLWREVTHVKALNFNVNNIDAFYQAANHIGDKKGCLLIQFPGKITLGYFSQVEQILQRLTEIDGADNWRKAVEFRSPTWYEGETFELLDQYGASIVLHDMPKSKNFSLNKAATFAYFRYHGPAGDYRGSYSNEFLNEQSETIRTWLMEGKDVYAYFNNTMGSAYENVMSLKAMVEK